MKNPLFPALLALSLLISPAFAEDDTPLAEEMNKISKVIKLVKRNLADPTSKDANVAKLDEAKASAEKALTLEPAKTKDVPAAEKAKFLEDYKAGMQGFIKGLDELKTAVAAGKQDDAAKILEKLESGKKEAHKKFQKDE
jgi:soluble cytochrome b562